MSDRSERLMRAVRRECRINRIRRAEKLAALIGFTTEGCHYWALRVHGNLAKCSCPMCGNPRKWRGEVTRQEQRQSRFDQEQN